MESGIDTLVRLYALGDFECTFCLRNVDAHGLLSVDVLAGGDSRFKVNVKIRWRRDLDQVQVLRVSKPLIAIRTAKEKLAVDRRVSKARVQFVEPILSSGEVILCGSAREP